MLKKVMDFFMNPPEMKYESSCFIPSDEADFEDVVNQIYNVKNLRKWFCFFPCLWARYDKPYLDAGCVGKLYFFLTPFCYQVTYTDVIPDQYYRLKISGLLRGEMIARFIHKEDGVIFEHPYSCTAVNRLVHIYYLMFLRGPHLPYMAWRYKTLKRNAMRDTLKKKQRNAAQDISKMKQGSLEQ